MLNNFLQVIVYILCASLIFYLLFWLIDYCNLPEPFSKVSKIILAIVVVTFLISIIGNILLVLR